MGGAGVGGAVAFILLLLLAGCVEEAPAAPAQRDTSDRPDRPVVIALIDTGLNPYHAAFAARPGPDAATWAEAFNATPVRLSANGSFDARLSTDEAFWRDVDLGRLHAFEGTRLLGISLSHGLGRPALRDSPAALGHGTMTSSLAAREAPEALVLMIQTNTVICSLDRPHEQCPVFANVAPAMEWAADQPWIDVISVSINFPGNPPNVPGVQEGVREFLAASRLAHERGKLLVVAAGNSVTPPLVAQYAGPPWAIAVGGYEPAQRGESPGASKLVDVVGNFTETGAREGTTAEARESSGTSLAAPVVAGVLAEALGRVRQAQPQAEPVVLRDALREALNASAEQGAPGEWRPDQPSSNDTFAGVLTRSLPVVAPALQQGWGYVHGGLAGEIARRVLEDDLAPPPGKAPTAAYMAQHHALRERYWSR